MGSTNGAAMYCVKMEVLIAARFPPDSSTITIRLLALGVALTAEAAGFGCEASKGLQWAGTTPPGTCEAIWAGDHTR